MIQSMKMKLSFFCVLCLGMLSCAAQGPAPQPEQPAPAPAATAAPEVAQPTPAPSPSAVEATPAPAAGGDLKVAKAQPVEDVDVMTRLQIFLDQQKFGPGKIDGKGKLFTAQALDRYRQAHGLPINGLIDKDIPLDSVYPIFTTYQIKQDDLKYVGDWSIKPAVESKLKYAFYPSMLEFVSERYHSDPDFLAKLNKGMNLEKLKPGDTVRVPNVEPFKLEDLVENPFAADEEGICEPRDHRRCGKQDARLI